MSVNSKYHDFMVSMENVLTEDELKTLKGLPSDFIVEMYENEIKFGPQGSLIFKIISDLRKELEDNNGDVRSAPHLGKLFYARANPKIAPIRLDAREIIKTWYPERVSTYSNIVMTLAKEIDSTKSVTEAIADALFALSFRDLIWNNEDTQSFLSWDIYYSLTEPYSSVVGSKLHPDDEDYINPADVFAGKVIRL